MYLVFLKFGEISVINMGKGKGSGGGKGSGKGCVKGGWSGEDYKGKPERMTVPAMPAPAAVFYCFLNFLMPGLGETLSKILFEPPRDKTNKMACAPCEDSDQPWHLRCPHEESLDP